MPATDSSRRLVTIMVAIIGAGAGLIAVLMLILGLMLSARIADGGSGPPRPGGPQTEALYVYLGMLLAPLGAALGAALGARLGRRMAVPDEPSLPPGSDTDPAPSP